MYERDRSEVSDRELLVRVADGDFVAFGALFDRWQMRLGAFFRSRGVLAADVEDLVGECLEAVWRRRAGFVSSSAPGSAWIFGIARRVVARYWRDRMSEVGGAPRLEVVIDLTDDGGFEAVEDRVDAEASASRLWEAMRALPVGEHDAVLLRVVEAHSYPEIARLLNCSEAAARQRVSRGLRRLRDALAADGC